MKKTELTRPLPRRMVREVERSFFFLFSFLLLAPRHSLLDVTIAVSPPPNGSR